MADTTTETTATSATGTTDTGAQSAATTTIAQVAGTDAATQGQSSQGASTSTAQTAATSTTTTTDATKTGDAAATDATKTDGTANADAAKTGAPEAYTAYTLPQGVNMSSEVTTKLNTVAKEFNLTQEGAQKFVDIGVELQKELSANLSTQIANVHTQWETQSKTDKEFGGDSFEVNVALANQAARTFGSPAFMQLMKESGLEKHPEVIRTFLAVGKAISPDTLVGGDGSPPGGDTPRSALSAAASKLYGATNK